MRYSLPLFMQPSLSVIALLLALPMILSGCAGLADRADHAADIARQAGMKQEIVEAGPFAMTAFTKITQPGKPVSFYIEGDGFAWVDRGTPSGDPTPKHPIGLQLAAADGGPNIIYLARPCQYSRMANGGVCSMHYWTDARMAPEVVDALNAEIETFKARYRFDTLDLTGFSGGGSAAVLLAARRYDVTGLRTVAGNLDQILFSQIHHITPMTGSMEPRDAALAVAHIPQIHFVGADDAIVPRAIAESFRDSAGSPACLRIRDVDAVGHDEGWVARWPALRAEPLPCAAAGH